MQVTRSGTVSPVEAARRPHARDKRDAPAESLRTERPKSTEIAVRDGERIRTSPSAAAVPAPLATQLLAQKTSAKSARRLARHFPERAHAAYLAAAAGPGAKGPTKTVSA